MSSSLRKNRIENLCHLKGRLVVLLLVLDIDIVFGIREGGSVSMGEGEQGGGDGICESVTPGNKLNTIPLCGNPQNTIALANL